VRGEDDITAAMRRHGDTVWRVCLLRMGSRADAQDAFQETFYSYATHDGVRFADEEHRKAWLVKVATNRCIDMLRVRSRVEPLDEGLELADPASLESTACAETKRVSEALAGLPANQRQAVYLTICEGYAPRDVAQMMGAPVKTVYSWIDRGKKHLKEALS